jgi:malonyl-CoA decarboxylase
MAFEKFQDFLSGLVKGQRGFFSGGEKDSIDKLVQRLMGSEGEVSGIVTARQVLDRFQELDDEHKLLFFQNLEQNFNANPAMVRLAFNAYDKDPSSFNLGTLSKASEPLRHELLRRLNQTPGATHDLVAMRADLLGFLKTHPELLAVDNDFVRLFTSWFGRGFLELRTIDWSTSAAVLERIIRYEAVHAIKDWDDLRSRIDPPNRRCFAFFHPALVDEPLIFVEVALTGNVPESIAAILEEKAEAVNGDDFKTAVFYSISNCQPGLRNISFGNFLIKQVVQELQMEFPSIKTFVTLSPVPGFGRWLLSEEEGDADASPTAAQEEQNPREDKHAAALLEMKRRVAALPASGEAAQAHAEEIRSLVFHYLTVARKGKYPLDPVARFHLGNGASLYRIHAHADMSEKGLRQSRGAMVNYLYDLASIEMNHEAFANEGRVKFSDKLKSLAIKA